MALKRLRLQKRGHHLDDADIPKDLGATPDNPEQHEHDESNWLMSYADMMTLLCIFFVMMYTLSKVDQPKFEKVKKELSTHFGGDYQSPNSEFAKFVTQIMQEAGIDKDVVVISDASGVSVVFQSTLFFDTLSAFIREPGKVVLTKLIEAIKGRQDAELREYKIVIEGHTDGRPVLGGQYPSNWELSGARAARVVRLFIQNGFSAKNLVAIGYGETRPRANNRTPSGEWDEQALAKNRRVVVRILDPKVDSVPWDTARE